MWTCVQIPWDLSCSKSVENQVSDKHKNVRDLSETCLRLVADLLKTWHILFNHVPKPDLIYSVTDRHSDKTADDAYDDDVDDIALCCSALLLYIRPPWQLHMQQWKENIRFGSRSTYTQRKARDSKQTHCCLTWLRITCTDSYIIFACDPALLLVGRSENVCAFVVSISHCFYLA